MTTVQLTGAAAYDSQMVIHTSTANLDIILAREFQKNLSDPTRTHGLLDNIKGIKRASKVKWTDHEYNIQYRKDVSHISVKIPCETTQFPELSFCGQHAKAHGVRGLSRHYHFQLYPTFFHGKCTILRITRAFIKFKNMF